VPISRCSERGKDFGLLAGEFAEIAAETEDALVRFWIGHDDAAVFAQGLQDSVLDLVRADGAHGSNGISAWER
jgi:hypothetical protein